VYVEYASELPIDWFIALAEQARELEHASHLRGHVATSCSIVHVPNSTGVVRGVDLWSLARMVSEPAHGSSTWKHAMDMGIVDLLA